MSWHPLISIIACSNPYLVFSNQEYLLYATGVYSVHCTEGFNIKDFIFKGECRASVPPPPKKKMLPFQHIVRYKKMKYWKLLIYLIKCPFISKMYYYWWKCKKVVLL